MSTVAVPDSTLRAATTRFTPIALLVATSLVLYWPTGASLYELWMSPDNPSLRHGPLIVVVFAWLLWRVRTIVTATPARPWFPGYVLLLLASAFWVILWRAALQGPYLLLTPVLLWLAVVAACGTRVALPLAFPFAFLWFAMPAWGSLTRPLQTVTVHVVTLMTNLLGTPASHDGFVIWIPAGAFEVGSGCSGSHYLVIGLAVAALIGEVEGASWRRRGRLLAVMAAGALLANWLRVLTIVIAGQATHMQHYLVTRDHYWFGWGLFATFLVLFLWYVERTRPAASVLPPAEAHARMASPATSVSYAPVAGAFLTLAVVPVIAYWVASGDEAAPQPLLIELPAGSSGWSGPVNSNDSPWHPVFVGASSLQQASYGDGSGSSVELLVASYSTQRQGAELVNWANSLTGPQLQAASEQAVTSSELDFHETEVVDSHGHHSLIWSVYDIGDQSMVTPLFAQLWYGTRAMVGAPRSSLVAVRTGCDPDCDSARAELGRFVRPMWAGIGLGITTAHKIRDARNAGQPVPGN